MAKTNKEILNAIRNDASAEYKERVPEVRSGEDIERVLRAYESYPTVQNEFLGALTNKVFRTVVMNKVWNNPLVMLKKGEIPYGQGIEQMFVEMADRKNFWDHFKDAGGTVEGDLIKQEKPSISNHFIQRNFAYKYKASLSNQRIRAAFATPNGLASLIDGQVASVMTAANNAEFEDMLAILTRSQDNNSSDSPATHGLGKKDKGILHRAAALTNHNTKNKMLVKLDSASVSALNEKDLAVKIRTYASELTFLSDSYNLAGVKTACNPEDLVLFTTSEVVAKLDVNLLAEAFNVSKADVNVRVIRLPQKTFKDVVTGNWGTSGSKNVTPVAILADKDVIQQYDSLVESGSFYNPDQLMTNMFVHRQGITATCDFAQFVVFGIHA